MHVPQPAQSSAVSEGKLGNVHKYHCSIQRIIVQGSRLVIIFHKHTWGKRERDQQKGDLYNNTVGFTCFSDGFQIVIRPSLELSFP